MVKPRKTPQEPCILPCETLACWSDQKEFTVSNPRRSGRSLGPRQGLRTITCLDRTCVLSKRVVFQSRKRTSTNQRGNQRSRLQSTPEEEALSAGFNAIDAQGLALPGPCAHPKEIPSRLHFVSGPLHAKKGPNMN